MMMLMGLSHAGDSAAPGRGLGQPLRMIVVVAAAAAVLMVLHVFAAAEKRKKNKKLKDYQARTVLDLRLRNIFTSLFSNHILTNSVDCS